MIPCVSSTVLAVISCVDINISAITFGSIPVPTTDFAVPRSTVSYVRESSGLDPIALGVPGPVMSIAFTLVVNSAAAVQSVRATGIHASVPLVRVHRGVGYVIWLLLPIQ